MAGHEQSPKSLVDLYGPLIGGPLLQRALGYTKGGTFRAAMAAKRIPVPCFRLEGRRGWFARTRDVEEWLSGLSNETTCNQDACGPDASGAVSEKEGWTM